ncbi:MAG: glycosyltransferase family 4 protein [Bryobacteraceae bacterium]
MRVLIDATSVLFRSAGIKSYTYHWIEHLRKLSSADEVLAFPFLDGLGELTHQRSDLSFLATYPRLALAYFVNIPGNPAMDWINSRVDVFHASNQIRNPPKKTRLTATIHDLTCWLMPDLHTAANLRADKSFAEQVLPRADRLIAVSENSRADAVRVLGLDPGRVEVIHSGVPQSYFDARPAPAKKPYVLFVGTIEPRKNIDTLLDAWHLVKAGLRKEFDLAIAGAPGWSAARTVRRLEAEIADVRYLGYVPEDQLPGLTAGATVFVYPSLYEGFGFPVAQAMACGVPVITSDNSCLPEIAGPGALFVDPRSAAEIASVIERMLTSPGLRERIATAGAARAQQYRWEVCARKSLEFFRKALG